MKGIEFNKIIASILLPVAVFAFITNFVDILYKPDEFNSTYVSSYKKREVLPQNDPKDFDKLLLKADANKGKIVSRKCTSCHTFEKDGANRVGPNLWNIVDAKKAHNSSFNYSKAMRAQTGYWKQDELIAYLRSPQKVVPGTKMSFVGISNDSELVDLLAYLKSMGDGKTSGGK